MKFVPRVSSEFLLCYHILLGQNVYDGDIITTSNMW